jgi:hypothetical protein
MPILRCTPNNDIIFYGRAVKHVMKEMNLESKPQHGRKEGREGFKKLVKYIKKIGLFHGYRK